MFKKVSIYSVLIVTFILITSYAFNFINKIDPYSLSESEIQTTLAKNKFDCNNFEKCNLKPGDILIRRLKTSKTRLLTKFTNLYFTHSAMYIGKKLVVEATGNEKNDDDEIIIQDMKKDGWLNKNSEWVIFRPVLNDRKLQNMINNLKNIAEDQKQTFGLIYNSKPSTKHSCADLIFNELINESLLTKQNTPAIITPDYLFYLCTNSNSFKLVGTNIINSKVTSN